MWQICIPLDDFVFVFNIFTMLSLFFDEITQTDAYIFMYYKYINVLSWFGTLFGLVFTFLFLQIFLCFYYFYVRDNPKVALAKIIKRAKQGGGGGEQTIW